MLWVLRKLDSSWNLIILCFCINIKEPHIKLNVYLELLYFNYYSSFDSWVYESALVTLCRSSIGGSILAPGSPDGVLICSLHRPRLRPRHGLYGRNSSKYWRDFVIQCKNFLAQCPPFGPYKPPSLVESWACPEGWRIVAGGCRLLPSSIWAERVVTHSGLLQATPHHAALGTCSTGSQFSYRNALSY